MDEVAEERAPASRAWERSAESLTFRRGPVARGARADRAALGSATQITRCHAAFPPS